MPQILVVDLGSQYAQVIGRALGEIGFRSAILDPNKIRAWLKDHDPKCIILSGGDNSVYQEGAKQPPRSILDLGIPILGICYGMQWLAYVLNGRVEPAPGHREYGPAQISLDNNPIFGRTPYASLDVWASHGDSVVMAPQGFAVICRSSDGGIAGIHSMEKRMWGLQFHPEVDHTQYGREILHAFVADISGCQPDWSLTDIIADKREMVRQSLGGTGKAILALSGGVDSTTLAAIVAPELGSQVTGVVIDTGGLRAGELEEIKANCQAAGIGFQIIDASLDFIQALAGVLDAEEKRRIFKELYERTLMYAAQLFVGATHIIQGTLATDMIESGNAGGSALIKSHHNVGLKFHGLIQLHPLSDLFKHEIRALARSKDLALPSEVFDRHPFPGPGLFIRIIGGDVTETRLEILREADLQVRMIVSKYGLDGQFSQLVVALDCTPTVGVKGDGRTYAYSVIVRAVVTRDFMTADGYQFPPEVRREITQLLTKHPEIVRVFWDETPKPPATTEMQ